MKTKAHLIPTLLAVFATLTCCQPPAPVSDWTRVGTWTNSEYETTGAHFAKIVVGGDGSLQVYNHVADSTPAASGTFVVDNDWTETAIHWFEVTAVLSGTIYYQLERLTNGGNAYEMMYSKTAYPTSFDSASPFYTIRYRQ